MLPFHLRNPPPCSGPNPNPFKYIDAVFNFISYSWDSQLGNAYICRYRVFRLRKNLFFRKFHIKRKSKKNRGFLLSFPSKNEDQSCPGPFFLVFFRGHYSGLAKTRTRAIQTRKTRPNQSCPKFSGPSPGVTL